MHLLKFAYILCSHKAALPVCDMCSNPIRSKVKLQMDGKLFHCRCLVCSKCGSKLSAEEKCYVKDGKILCQADYFRCVLTRHRWYSVCLHSVCLHPTSQESWMPLQWLPETSIFQRLGEESKYTDIPSRLLRLLRVQDAILYRRSIRSV